MRRYIELSRSFNAASATISGRGSPALPVLIEARVNLRTIDALRLALLTFLTTLAVRDGEGAC